MCPYQNFTLVNNLFLRNASFRISKQRGQLVGGIELETYMCLTLSLKLSKKTLTKVKYSHFDSTFIVPPSPIKVKQFLSLKSCPIINCDTCRRGKHHRSSFSSSSHNRSNFPSILSTLTYRV